MFGWNVDVELMVVCIVAGLSVSCIISAICATVVFLRFIGAMQGMSQYAQWTLSAHYIGDDEDEAEDASEDDDEEEEEDPDDWWRNGGRSVAE